MKLLSGISKRLLIFLIIGTYGTLMSQESLTLASKPQLKISGTSSLHDWDMVSEVAEGKLTATIADNQITDITSMVVKMPAESIKSGKNGMDKNAYKAMYTDKHKYVTFNLKSAIKTGDGSWTLNGTFSIAGTTKSVDLKVKQTSANGSYSFSGSHAFKLTDYGIEPPKALMGTIKTGDEVTISFNVNFK